MFVSLELRGDAEDCMDKLALRFTLYPTKSARTHLQQNPAKCQFRHAPVYKVVTGLLVELRAREQQAAQELSFSGSDGWSYLSSPNPS